MSLYFARFIRFVVEGKEVDPRNLRDALQRAILEKISQSIQQRLQQVRTMDGSASHGGQLTRSIRVDDDVTVLPAPHLVTERLEADLIERAIEAQPAQQPVGVRTKG